ncbi:hypothetical protein QQP08_026762 [Theobroma cacao]|nr:hypothetical protein QQP08_026762 [Theobroma cacao]
MQRRKSGIMNYHCYSGVCQGQTWVNREVKSRDNSKFLQCKQHSPLVSKSLLLRAACCGCLPFTVLLLEDAAMGVMGTVVRSDAEITPCSQIQSFLTPEKP